jgi:UDP-glucose 4-epimerase
MENLQLRIVIIGGGGYLGGRLAEYLNADTNYDVTIAKTSNLNLKSIIKEVHIDWNNLEAFFSVIENNDVLVYASGLGAIECNNNSIDAIEVNTIRPLKILNQIIGKNIYFCYFSTVHVYSQKPKGIIEENSSITNSHPYASTHAITEKMIEWYKSAGKINGTSLRISNVYGLPLNKNSNGWGLVINQLCRSAHQDKKIVIKSKGDQKRDFIAMNDFLTCVKSIIEDKPEENSINIVSGATTSIKEAAQCIRHNYKILTGISLPIVINNDELVEEETYYKYKTNYHTNPKKEKLIKNKKNNEIIKTLLYCINNK